MLIIRLVVLTTVKTLFINPCPDVPAMQAESSPRIAGKSVSGLVALRSPGRYRLDSARPRPPGKIF